ncbi:hypothetical protein LAZ67_16001302 [Cordylochernes scorpioides]|uniref:TIL domain-containing protein n=1 Tax=Cordylochernes scorpioides TaxID=51811 RepID=A0ABY6LDY0_9ARAC|nr:hypothetical protein LAZ67_16001302 [Cordylochernes scorpioides]
MKEHQLYQVCCDVTGCTKPGEIYQECGTACPRTCDNMGVKISCIDKCVEGCFCRDGLVRNSKGDCVRPKCCRKSKLPLELIIQLKNHTYGESYKGISSERLLQVLSSMKYPSNQCMYNSVCTECTKPHEVYLTCGSSCPDTCDNYNDTSRVCTLQCVQGCFCEKGYVRNSKGDCVLPSQCPKGEILTILFELVPK